MFAERIGRLVICADKGWYLVEAARTDDWSAPEVRFYPERPAIHLQDVVVGARVVGVRSYSGETLLMQVFQRWRTGWLERGDLLIVRSEELALISNQSAIPGEPDIRLLTLVHPGFDPEIILRVQRCLARLQQQRRTFGLGYGPYRSSYLQQLGIEPLPLSARYRPREPDSLWGEVTLDYPEALLCLELHGRPQQTLFRKTPQIAG
ncbi:hypothetical protein [Gloeobacter kilaueensis]|uniref:Uncharacterized protein n=1 Tax=Gloeobacter kilaueensis (strain ATCC BAA-2537 / CCAP 1431/1 / ULC 316 / JS1) TaxID=1183438 RepID=U5QMQ3_GLOK1|nr:hypothetical protein [Gloeobacter kilaueensis]AGY58859.1 hypothetical protein GKIL_2613 [Gloeobacter kilaueensis JS1]